MTYAPWVRILPAAWAFLIAFGAVAQEAEKGIVELTNGFRASQRLAPLETNRELASAAREFADYLARHGKLDHTADGRQPAQRVAAQGYQYCIVAENLAQVYRASGYDAATLAADMVEGWKNSPEHRRSMLDPEVTEIGIGVARDARGRYFGVQLLGRPKAAAILFTLRNQSRHEVAYDAGERRFALPPRTERTHQVCRPLAVTIDVAEPYRARPQGGEQFVVVERQGTLVVQ